MNEDREVVNIDEQTCIIDWVTNNNKSFIENNNHIGCFEYLSEIETKYNNKQVNDIIQNIRNRIIERENLQKYPTAESLPDMIYCMQSGSKLHVHNDYTHKVDTGIMIRFNVCIQKPETGGRPIYSGKTIELIERNYIICRAELDYHTSEWMSGDKSKINISFGFIVDTASISRFSNRENIIAIDESFISKLTNVSFSPIGFKSGPTCILLISL